MKVSSVVSPLLSVAVHQSTACKKLHTTSTISRTRGTAHRSNPLHHLVPVHIHTPTTPETITRWKHMYTPQHQLSCLFRLQTSGISHCRSKETHLLNTFMVTYTLSDCGVPACSSLSFLLLAVDPGLDMILWYCS